nr:DNA helicase [Tanacetum cinerariifolium]
MLGGEVRQTLPVKKGGTRDEIIRSLVAKSYIWHHFKLHYLTENMRLSNNSLQEADREKVSDFAQWLLDIGNGHIDTPDESDSENTSWINVPDDYCIPDDENGMSNLIKFIYDDETLHTPTAKRLQEKAIVYPKNEMAGIINAKVLSMLPGNTHTYISFDEAIPHGHDGGDVELLYPKEYLNTLSFTGLPPYRLELKIGTPIMLLRNIDIAGGLCNGTRLIVTQLLPKLYVALSRATTLDGLKVLIHSRPGQPPTATKTIVYRDFLSELESEQFTHLHKTMATTGNTGRAKAR